jgi:hypothetical protein
MMRLSMNVYYNPLEHQCVWCGKYAGRLFCSNVCRKKYEHEDMEGAIPVGVCGVCEDDYYKHNPNQKYCCADCSRVALFRRRPNLYKKYIERYPEQAELYALFM